MRKGNERNVFAKRIQTIVSDDFNKFQQPFDDALPERLLRAVQPTDDERSIPLHQGTPNVTSPYIVRLSHAKGDAVRDALVVEDADIFADEAPLVEYHNGNLHFAEDCALDQIVEDGKETVRAGFKPARSFPIIGAYPAGRGYDQAVSVAGEVLGIEPKDIFAELLAEEFEKEEVQDVAPALSLEEVLDRIEVKEEEISIPEEQTFVVSYADGAQETLAAETLLPPASYQVLPRKHWKVHAKASLAFATLAAIVLLPLQASFVFASARSTKQQVEAQSSAGLSQFLRGTDALQEQDFSAASTLFGNASGAFASASDSLGDIHGVVAAAISLIPSTEKTATTARALVDIGEDVSRASTLLAKGMDDVSAAQALSVTDRLAIMVAYIEEALPEMEDAAAASQRIDLAVVPSDMHDRVAKMVDLLPVLAQSFGEVVTHADALSTLLGAGEKHTYMVVFQNNTELRATGGFMGSFAEVSFDNGAITDMRIPGGGTYDVQGQLQEFVAAPGPLQLVRARWEFQDANWFPDFPTSARKMLWFYESAGGPSVDGVLAINAEVLERLLTVLGPITLEDGTTLNAENVLFEMQKEAEINYDKETNQPKAIVGNLTQHIFDALAQANAQTLLQVASVFVDSLNERDMQVYFSDNELQSTMKALGWTGEMRQASDDYLMVVHTNIGGGKTDSVLKRDVTVDTTIAEDGTLENTVTLTQTHLGMAHALFTGTNNVDYVRLYIPKGSTFITGTGFEAPASTDFQTAEYPLAIDEDLSLEMQNVSKDPITQTDIWDEQGKTVLGNWIQTAPGETQTVSFTYRLPWNAMRTDTSHAWTFAKNIFGAHDALSYAMTVQKQSGVDQNVLVRVHVPPTFMPLWVSNNVSKDTLYEEQQYNDLFAGWIFER